MLEQEGESEFQDNGGDAVSLHEFELESSSSEDDSHTTLGELDDQVRLCVDGETAYFQTFHALVNLPNLGPVQQVRQPLFSLNQNSTRSQDSESNSTAGSISLLAGTIFAISRNNSGASRENFNSQDVKLELLLV